jgi:hypothetical protein
LFPGVRVVEMTRNAYICSTCTGTDAKCFHIQSFKIGKQNRFGLVGLRPVVGVVSCYRLRSRRLCDDGVVVDGRLVLDRSIRSAHLANHKVTHSQGSGTWVGVWLHFTRAPPVLVRAPATGRYQCIDWVQLTQSRATLLPTGNACTRRYELQKCTAWGSKERPQLDTEYRKYILLA